MYQSIFAPDLLAGQVAMVGRNAEKLRATQQLRAMCTTVPRVFQEQPVKGDAVSSATAPPAGGAA